MRRYHLILILLAAAFLLAIYFAVFYIPARAISLYGAPSPRLTISQRIQYSARLLSYGEALTAPLNPNAPQRTFIVNEGEAVSSIAARLQSDGLIANADAFRDYLIYTGLDVSLQAGTYSLSAAMSIVDIARAMQDATPQDVTFVILPGWRMEEIAASLPTSGLNISPEEFLSASQSPPPVLDTSAPLSAGFLPASASMEGFFYPDTYILPRASSVRQLIEAIARNFAQHLTQDLRDGFAAQGLGVYEAVTLASIVEREAVQAEESPLIASVYLNRLRIGMKLDADPTVQYALGYDSIGQTWWKNPLSAADLQFDSPFNTYVYAGLPPAPISNPGMDALRAVAFPAQTNYFFFRAQCDGSGYHVFAETFEEHLQNACQ